MSALPPKADINSRSGHDLLYPQKRTSELLFDDLVGICRGQPGMAILMIGHAARRFTRPTLRFAILLKQIKG
jgi:hypothetical protein